MTPVPVAEAFRESVEPAQIGELLPKVLRTGAATGVPAHPQLGAVPVYTSLTVHALPSSQGVPGRAEPPITPRQSTLHAPNCTPGPTTCELAVTFTPPRLMNQLELFACV